VLPHIAPDLTRNYPKMGHGGVIEPGIKLMIALRWLRCSRRSDMRDIVNFGRFACRCAHASTCADWVPKHAQHKVPPCAHEGQRLHG